MHTEQAVIALIVQNMSRGRMLGDAPLTLQDTVRKHVGSQTEAMSHTSVEVLKYEIQFY